MSNFLWRLVGVVALFAFSFYEMGGSTEQRAIFAAPAFFAAVVLLLNAGDDFGE